MATKSRKVSRRDLAKVETENVIMDPKIAWISGFGDEMKTLGKLHGVCVVIDEQIATNRDDDAVRLNGESWLAIASDDLMLHFLKGQFLSKSEGGREGKRRRLYGRVRMPAVSGAGRWRGRDG